MVLSDSSDSSLEIIDWKTDEIILIYSSSEMIFDNSDKVALASDDGDESKKENKKCACPRCQRMFSETSNITLKTCNHFICKECIIDHYFKNHNFKMRCEFKAPGRTVSCGTELNEMEIRSVLNEVGMNQMDETIHDDRLTSSRASLTPNEMPFYCGICGSDCPTGRGVKLTGCSHHVCEPCLRDTIKVNVDPEVRCPYAKSYERCGKFLTHSEIRRLVTSDEFKKFRQIAIRKAEETSELLLLTLCDELNYIQNVDAFDCPICFVPCGPKEGIKLKDCFHEFCLECFTGTVSHSDDDSVKCPFTDENLAHCENFIQEREIRAIVSAEIYNKFLERKLKFAEHSIANTFHCKTVDCPGFGIIEAGDDLMFCGICKQRNCLLCKAIHAGQNCEEYQDTLTGGFKMTERYIDGLKNVGDVMNCPKCQALINKIAGCSFIQCTFCKTGICWATKGPRWGPNGLGDTSGGCQCRLNGKLCHPKCENCH